MNPNRFFPLILALAATLGAQTPTLPKTPPAAKTVILAPLTNAERSAIAAALPAHARATPAQPRRVLVFDRTEGFVHASIPFGDEALVRLGEKTGAYAATVSADMAAFTPSSLASYDAVVFHNTTRLAFAEPAHRQALLDFVAAGKGIAGIHAATDNFPTWPEGQELIGGVFHNHPWRSNDVCAIKVDEPAHVLNSAFTNQGFWVREELYQITGPYGRDRQRVLLSLDMSRPENTRPADVIKRTDGDFPVSWIKTHGAGRVFYTSLGHNKDIFTTPVILQHLLDGLQFALGDLPADATPSASLPKPPAPALAPDDHTPIQNRPVAVATPAPLDPWTELATYTPARPPEPGPRAVTQLLRALPPAERIALEPRLLAILNSPSTPLAARRECLHLLALTGGPSAVPALQSTASIPEMLPDACAVLAGFANPAADDARLHLLESTREPAGRVTVINTFAASPRPAALKALALAAAEPAPVGPAALEALAALATPDALRALLKLPRDGDIAPARRAALAAAADRALRLTPTAAQRHAATRIAKTLLDEPGSPTERVTAARLLIAARGAEAAKTLLPLLAEPGVAADVARALALLADDRVFTLLKERLTTLAPAAQLAAVAGAGETRSPVAVPFLLRALTSADVSTRPAAALALGRCGDTSVAEPLLANLATPSPLADAAREALSRLPAATTDNLLRDRLASASNSEIRAALLRVLAARQDRATFPLAVAACAAPEATIRAAAFETVATLVRAGDLATVTLLEPRLQKSADRREWRRALFAATSLETDPTAAVRQLTAALAAPDSAERPALIGALTLIPHPGAEAALRSMLDIPDNEKRREVVRALSTARTEGALTLLLAHARSSMDSDERILTLRGYLDTLANLPLVSRKRQVAGYRDAWPLAQRNEEKRAILDAVRNIKGSEADAFVKIHENELAAP